SPWTLLTYMVEGGSSKNFSNVKKLIYNNPSLAHSVLNKLSEAVADYLSAKIEAGADAVQIFDTWGGILSPDDFEEFSLQYIQKIISQIKRKDEPVIYFPDRKSTRLNSSHVKISYAVFCLKKKN